jgi:hypothetical protein
VEHYEIAAYGSARTLAETLGEDEIVALLQQTLDEEESADKKLSGISEGEVIPAAPKSEDEGEDNAESSQGADGNGKANKASKKVGSGSRSKR